MKIEYSLIITASITIIGWFINSYLQSIRELKRKKQEIKTKYLTDAYRNISIFITRMNSHCMD